VRAGTTDVRLLMTETTVTLDEVVVTGRQSASSSVDRQCGVLDQRIAGARAVGVGMSGTCSTHVRLA
jgi:hypothetical protein